MQSISDWAVLSFYYKKKLSTGHWILDARYLMDKENTQFSQDAKNQLVRNLKISYSIGLVSNIQNPKSKCPEVRKKSSHRLSLAHNKYGVEKI